MMENYIDLSIAFYLLLYFLSGLRKSVSHTLSDILSLSLAIVLSLLTYHLTADFLSEYGKVNPGYAKAAGFFLSAFFFKMLLLFVFDHIFKKNENRFQPASPYFMKFLSGILSLLYGTLTIFILLAAMISLSLPAFITDELEGSRFVTLAEKDPIRINSGFRDIFGSVLSSAIKDLSFLEKKTGTEEKADLGFKALETSIDVPLEEQMLAKVNWERTSRGLKTLKVNEEARRASRDYGIYLFKNGMFSHTDLEGGGPGDRMKNYKVDYMMLGENLAYAPSLDEAHTGLMNSKGHRDNILNPFFGRVGIGVIDGKEYGKIFVQEFLD